MGAGECDRGRVEEIRLRARNLAENTFGIAKRMEELAGYLWEEARRLERWTEKGVKLYGIYYSAMGIKAELNQIGEMASYVKDVAEEVEKRIYDMLAWGCGESGEDN